MRPINHHISKCRKEVPTPPPPPKSHHLVHSPHSFLSVFTWYNLSDNLCYPLLRFPVDISRPSASIQLPSISFSCSLPTFELPHKRRGRKSRQRPSSFLFNAKFTAESEPWQTNGPGKASWRCLQVTPDSGVKSGPQT